MKRSHVSVDYGSKRETKTQVFEVTEQFEKTHFLSPGDITSSNTFGYRLKQELPPGVIDRDNMINPLTINVEAAATAAPASSSGVGVFSVPTTPKGHLTNNNNNNNNGIIIGDSQSTASLSHGGDSLDEPSDWYFAEVLEVWGESVRVNISSFAIANNESPSSGPAVDRLSKRELIAQSTSPTIINGGSTSSNEKFTVFVIEVTCGNRRWYVYRRYNAFKALYDVLALSWHNIPGLPRKNLFFTSNFSREFLGKRQRELNSWLQIVLKQHDLLKRYPIMVEFLSKESNRPPPGVRDPFLQHSDSGGSSIGGNGGSYTETEPVQGGYPPVMVPQATPITSPDASPPTTPRRPGTDEQLSSLNSSSSSSNNNNNNVHDFNNSSLANTIGLTPNGNTLSSSRLAATPTIAVSKNWNNKTNGRLEFQQQQDHDFEDEDSDEENNSSEDDEQDHHSNALHNTNSLMFVGDSDGLPLMPSPTISSSGSLSTNNGDNNQTLGSGNILAATASSSGLSALNGNSMMMMIDKPSSSMTQMQGNHHNHNSLLGSPNKNDSQVLKKNRNQNKKKIGLEDFEMVRVLGKGSFGKVILCRKKDDGMLYAIKVLKKNYVIKRRQVQHTQTERSVLGRIDHPFIVKLHYAFQTGEKLHFVITYAPGGELFFHLGRAGKFSEELGRFYAAEISLALGFLHSRHVVYRDLKPENILLDREGHVLLADFGLSKEGIRSGTEGTHSFCGTPEYLAPEVLNRQGHGYSVDWWSLGALLYEMLTGLPPWYSQERQKLFAGIRRGVLTFPSIVSPVAQSILTSFLNRDAAQRLGSKNDVEDVKVHPFFGSIDWDLLFQKKVVPPFCPCPTDSTVNFEETFTRLPLVSMGGAESIGGAAGSAGTYGPAADFVGFTYEGTGAMFDHIGSYQSSTNGIRTPPFPKLHHR